MTETEFENVTIDGNGLDLRGPRPECAEMFTLTDSALGIEMNGCVRDWVSE